MVLGRFGYLATYEMATLTLIALLVFLDHFPTVAALRRGPRPRSRSVVLCLTILILGPRSTSQRLYGLRVIVILRLLAGTWVTGRSRLPTVIFHITRELLLGQMLLDSLFS